ncbi:MAG: nucleotidyltransferase family protein [Nitrososphaerales archaeon]
MAERAGVVPAPSPGRGRERRGPISAVLLAAGRSSRFGSTKQLAVLGGETLLGRALATLRRSPVDEVIVVVGHRAEEVARTAPGARVVLNEEYGTGLASSLRVGIGAVAPGAAAAVVCLADQPFVSPRLVSRIVARHRLTGADVVASCCRAASGGALVAPPVLFGRRLFAEVAGLTGDRGAKAVIEAHPGFERVAVGCEALLDVDETGDLEAARAILRRSAVSRTARARGAGGPSPARPSSGPRPIRPAACSRRSG